MSCSTGAKRVEQLHPERNAEILRLWRLGHSGRQIATSMRDGLSRNAVIAVVNRAKARGEDVNRARIPLHSRGRPRVVKAKQEEKVARPKKSRTTQPQAARASAEAPPSAAGTAPLVVPTGHRADVVLGTPSAVGRYEATLALNPWECRFPVGDVRADDFRYCCAPTARGRYCAGHAVVCYVSVPG